MIRVDHRTIERHELDDDTSVVSGLAARGGECPEHADCHVEVDEPVVLRHRAVATDDQGRRFVDLSAAEWGCQRGAA